MNNIVITFENNVKKEYPKGVKLKEIIDSVKENYSYEIVCGKYKNQILGLEDAINKSGVLKLYDITSIQGNKIYEKGLMLLFEVSALKVLGNNIKIKIKHPVGKGIYFEIDKKVTEENLKEIKEVMKQKVVKVSLKDKIVSLGYSLLRYLFLFMVLTFAFPKLLKHIKTRYVYNKFGDYLTTSGVGVLGMFMFPIIAILLLISNIGVSVGLIMFVLYIILIYMTTIVSGYVLGNLIGIKLFKKELYK